ncbi:MAG: hypothetical protein ACE5ET_03400, partial [Gammaproteobacteria bacterium]
MNDQTRLWQAQLMARLHDPVEKALILMRTTEGHEGGTSAVLRERLGLNDIPSSVRRAVRQADHWASAADRAAFPNHEEQGRYPRWQQVRFHERPVIIHPLTGESFDLKTLADIEPQQARALAEAHLQRLIHGGDLRRTALAFWRFGPEIDTADIKSLWAQLPADTRVPDHSIHDHLDLTVALATVFAADAGGPALLGACCAALHLTWSRTAAGGQCFRQLMKKGLRHCGMPNMLAYRSRNCPDEEGIKTLATKSGRSRQGELKGIAGAL